MYLFGMDLAYGIVFVHTIVPLPLIVHLSFSPLVDVKDIAMVLIFFPLVCFHINHRFLIIDTFSIFVCTGLPSVGRSLWLSLFDAGDRGPVDGRVRMRMSPQRNAGERPWRSQLRPAPACQYVHNVHWRQYGPAEQELVLSNPPSQSAMPKQQQSPIASSPAPPSHPQWSFQPLPTRPLGSCRPVPQKVFLLVQRKCQHATPMLAFIIGSDGRMRRGQSPQPRQQPTAEVCLPLKLLQHTVGRCSTTRTALWWAWFTNEPSFSRQHHGRIAHLKDSQCCSWKQLHGSQRLNKNKRDLLRHSCRPCRL